MKKLGIYLETNYYYERQANKLFCEDIYTNLFNSFSLKIFKLHFLGKSVQEKNKSYYEVLKPISFHEVSYYDSLVSLFLKTAIYFPKNIDIIKEFVNVCDIFLIMTPSPIANTILHLAQKENKKCNVLVRQNSYETIPNRYFGLKRIFAGWFTLFMEGWVERYSKKYQPTVFALGEENYKRYFQFSQNTIHFVSSRYKNSDVIQQRSVRPIEWIKEIHVLYVGRLEVNKGLRELVRAFNEFEKYSIRLSIIGDGTMREEIEEMILVNNLSDRVFLKGFIPFGPQLFDEYDRHHMLILPSYSEGLPQVILEGMARGCLILATNVGGIPGIIEHKKTGYLFAPFSSDEIIRTITYLIENDINTGPICIKALKTAEQYSFENQIDNLVENLN